MNFGEKLVLQLLLAFIQSLWKNFNQGIQWIEHKNLTLELFSRLQLIKIKLENRKVMTVMLQKQVGYWTK